MNSSIKRRQTLLINWLAKTLNCTPIIKAETGSYYTEFTTLYTGKSVIRISDHLSRDRTYIHVLLSPLDTNVTVVYKNFIRTTGFSRAKDIIYTLIMSKAMTETVNPIPNSNKLEEVKATKSKTPNFNYSITKSEISRLSTDLQKEIVGWIKSSIKKNYKSLNDIPVDTIYLSKKQYNKIKQYLND